MHVDIVATAHGLPNGCTPRMAGRLLCSLRCGHLCNAVHAHRAGACEIEAVRVCAGCDGAGEGLRLGV